MQGEATEAVSLAMDVLPRLVRALTQACRTPGLGEEPLTLTQVRLLQDLGEGPLSSSELAVRTDVTPATTSTAIDGLVRRGLVERLTSPEDRRIIPLRRTPAGGAALEAARRRQGEALMTLFADLSPAGARQLAAGLRAVERVLDAKVPR